MFKPDKSSHFVKVTACFIWSHVAVSSRRDLERGRKSENETRHSAREIFILSRGGWLFLGRRQGHQEDIRKNRWQFVGERNHSDWLFSAKETNSKEKESPSSRFLSDPWLHLVFFSPPPLLHGHLQLFIRNVLDYEQLNKRERYQMCCFNNL